MRCSASLGMRPRRRHAEWRAATPDLALRGTRLTLRTVWRRAWVAVAAVVLVALTLAGCSSSGPSASHTKTTAVTPSSSAAAKLAGKVGCTNYADTATSAIQVGPKPVSAGQCTVNGESLQIKVYANAAALAAAKKAANASCLGMTSFTKPTAWYAIGPTWVTTAILTQDAAQLVAAKTGGTASDVQC